MAISFVIMVFLLSSRNEPKRWRAQGKLSHELCSPSLIEPIVPPPSPPLFSFLFYSLLIVIVL